MRLYSGSCLYRKIKFSIIFVKMYFQSVKMKPGLILKNTFCIVMYLMLEYYLLPFSPLYLCYSSQHSYSEVPCKTSSHFKDSNHLTLNSYFPQKYKIRFYIDPLLAVDPYVDTFINSTEEKVLHCLQSNYSNPFVYLYSGRGPPLA